MGKNKRMRDALRCMLDANAFKNRDAELCYIRDVMAVGGWGHMEGLHYDVSKVPASKGNVEVEYFVHNIYDVPMMTCSTLEELVRYLMVQRRMDCGMRLVGWSYKGFDCEQRVVRRNGKTHMYVRGAVVVVIWSRMHTIQAQSFMGSRKGVDWADVDACYDAKHEVKQCRQTDDYDENIPF